jgi:sirohydrochlorin ferrochelatase
MNRLERATMCSWMSLVVCWLIAAPVFASPSGTGFLVVAPDRGALGNEEIRRLFEEFNQSYRPASLVFVGRDYRGPGTEYSPYLSGALSDLTQAGVTNLIAIPLFLSSADPILANVMASLPSYDYSGSIGWAQPMADSYLIGQIILDRAAALSRQPSDEGVLIVGFGATDQNNERAMQGDLKKLADYLGRYHHFRETQQVVYYDRAAPEAEERNRVADSLITHMAAKKGRALAVMASLGPKFDHGMSLMSRMKTQFREIDVVLSDEELLPHPNVLRWLKKTANAYQPAAASEVGVVIMPHGANQVWNDAVEQVVAPLRATYAIEMAFGMGDARILQEAVSNLEARHMRKIVFVRLYALTRHLKERTDYILGLTDSPTAMGHGGHDTTGTYPPQVRTAAQFETVGGYEETSDVARILHERIVEISTAPADETVFLVAHGEKLDEDDAKWRALINAHIETLKQDPHCAQLKAIRAATVREDWPDKRDKAVKDIRDMIETASQTGRALLIADRLYGSGPYPKLFQGLDYTLNDKGLAHPVLTGWLRTAIDRAAATLTAPRATPSR